MIVSGFGKNTGYDKISSLITGVQAKGKVNIRKLGFWNLNHQNIQIVNFHKKFTKHVVEDAIGIFLPLA